MRYLKTRRVRKQRGGVTPYQTTPRSSSGEVNGYSWAGALHGGYTEWKKDFTGKYALTGYTEDRYAIAPLGTTGLAAVVLDGHAGQDVAELASKELPSLLASNIHEDIFEDTAALEAAIQKSFLDFSKTLVDKLGYRAIDMGAACTVAIITPKYVVMGNVGDCVGLLTTRDGSQFTTTIDHDCENPEEVLRLNAIQKKRKGLPPCVDTMKDAGVRLRGQLAMTRALGDLKYDPYISAVPQTYVATREPNQRIILTSDSFTEGIAPSRVNPNQNVIKNILTREQVLAELTPQLNEDGSLEQNVSKAVTTRVNKLWYPTYAYQGDNTALLVVELPDVQPSMKIGSNTNVYNISGFFEPKEGGRRYTRRHRKNKSRVRKH